MPLASLIATSSATNWLPEKKSRIAVAMSGGVDSSVVAHLLAKAGHECIGLTAWTLNGPGSCCNDALVNAGRVCEDLNMQFDTVDLRAEFAHYVMDYYNQSYEAGVTPNPCVECNRYVKWEKLVDYAVNELGVDYVATGHYIRLGRDAAGHHQIFRAEDERKDQTYMMARVYPKDIDRALFPLGDWVKKDVVEYAKAVEIPTAYSKESMDVCFVLDGQSNYLKGSLGIKKGPIVDVDSGKTVGEHDGHYLFTRGQRKGVMVAVGRPIYVVKTDAKTNTVYVGDAHHLESNTFRVTQPNWLVTPQVFPFEAMVKVRYASPPQKAMISEIEGDDGELLVSLYEPVSAITPGQIAAFYCPEFKQLLGGGYIEKTLGQTPFDPALAKPLPNLHCEPVAIMV